MRLWLSQGCSAVRVFWRFGGGVACVAVFVREEEEREREERGAALGLCAWRLFLGRRNCWRLCRVESTENGCATTAVVLAPAPNSHASVHSLLQQHSCLLQQHSDSTEPRSQLHNQGRKGNWLGSEGGLGLGLRHPPSAAPTANRQPNSRSCAQTHAR